MFDRAHAAVLFDCDGVVVDSETIGVEVERAFLEEIGLDYNAAELFTRFGELSDVDFSQAVDEGKIKKGKGERAPLHYGEWVRVIRNPRSLLR